ncbi:MAG: L,D-transpeptidase [Bacteroidales bacterium]
MAPSSSPSGEDAHRASVRTLVVDRLRNAGTWVRSYRTAFLLLALVLLAPVIVRFAVWSALNMNTGSASAGTPSEEDPSAIRKELASLDKKLDAKRPRSYFLIINSSANEFELYKGKELIRKDMCSTGNYVLLKNGEAQQWLFKTPKGEFRILGKTTAPVWRKPDWAFVEEGLPVPSATHSSRYEYGVLGDYALSLGDGYLIHGTLYQRFLGLPVTHGCVRLNDANLELVYKSLPVGSKVYIY